MCVINQVFKDKDMRDLILGFKYKITLLPKLDQLHNAFCKLQKMHAFTPDKVNFKKFSNYSGYEIKNRKHLYKLTRIYYMLNSYFGKIDFDMDIQDILVKVIREDKVLLSFLDNTSCCISILLKKQYHRLSDIYLSRALKIFKENENFNAKILAQAF